MCLNSPSEHSSLVLLKLITKTLLVAASNLVMLKEPRVAGVVLLASEPQRSPSLTLSSYIF